MPTVLGTSGDTTGNGSNLQLNQVTPTSPVVAYGLDFDATASGDRGVIVPKSVGQAFVITRYSMTMVTQAGTCTVALGINVGTTPATYTDILSNASPASTVQINLGTGQTQHQNITGLKVVDNADIHVYVQTVAVGTGGFALTARIQLFGYWTKF